jgi:hypothetical protein
MVRKILNATPKSKNIVKLFNICFQYRLPGGARAPVRMALASSLVLVSRAPAPRPRPMRARRAPHT